MIGFLMLRTRLAAHRLREELSEEMTEAVA